MHDDAIPSAQADIRDERCQVVVVDDDPMVLQALRAYLKEDDRIEVLRTFNSAKQALAFLRHHQVHVLITDVRMPGTDGLELLTTVKQEMPETAVIMLTSFDDDEAMRTSLDQRANGFLLKDSSPEEVIRAVHAARDGGTTISPATASRLVAHHLRPMAAPRPGITQAETEVLALLCEGCSNAEIAEKLCLSEATVKTHISHVMKKYGVNSRLKLVVAVHQEEMRPAARVADDT
ncbi:response regulator transcription factor [Schaalia sp. 19OD2882]|uniref:response regulator n=1 Tax=Schaalia sp. 19OD2882 TaxID=2794089 RepID=UPI001C1EE479|nr:response regulator transcription factor [Schaalia sp. 19OD2882]QWW20008.1 response regulator transcription factor [Schaalia sp. 19OD2882]